MHEVHLVWLDWDSWSLTPSVLAGYLGAFNVVWFQQSKTDSRKRNDNFITIVTGMVLVECLSSDCLGTWYLQDLGVIVATPRSRSCSVAEMAARAHGRMHPTCPLEQELPGLWGVQGRAPGLRTARTWVWQRIQRFPLDRAHCCQTKAQHGYEVRPLSSTSPLFFSEKIRASGDTLSKVNCCLLLMCGALLSPRDMHLGRPDSEGTFLQGHCWCYSLLSTVWF